jgi:autotransporter passenger strand-loop-strand repeat protein
MTVITHANSPYKISAGFTEIGDVVSSGGTMIVLSNGVATTTTVKSGGFLTISSGGTGGNATIAGKETVLGFDLVTSVLKGGSALVSSGGLDISATVRSGGFMEVLSGGTAVSATVSSGGVLQLVGSGTVSGDSVNNGTLEVTANGGLIIGSHVDNAGKIEALGANVGLTISSATIFTPQVLLTSGSTQVSSGSSASAGLLVVSGGGAHADLDNANFADTTFATSGANAVIDTVSGSFNRIDAASITSGSLLKINDGSELTLYGLVKNSGTISANGTSDAGTYIEVLSGVELTGGGKLLLSPAGQAEILNWTSGNTASSGTLENLNNTIEGAGQIGNGGGLILINDGIIDANLANGLYFETGSSVVSNAKTIEATNSGGLILNGVTISNTAAGVVMASGADAKVILAGATVEGGTVKTAGAGAVITTEEASSNTISGVGIAAGSLVQAVSSGTLYLESATISSGATVKASGGGELILVGGTIDAGGMVETLAGGTAGFGGVSNSGTIFASGSGSVISFLGVVSGGVTEIGNGTVTLAGGEAITFQSGGTGTLKLVDSAGDDQAYDGKISGFGQNTHQTIDLIEVASGASVSATYASATASFVASGTLTVSSGGTIVAEIALVGHYTTANFKLGKDSNGDVTIVDPPVAAGGGQSTNLALFGSYIAASFVSGGGIIGTGPAQPPETSDPPLTHPAHT